MGECSAVISDASCRQRHWRLVVVVQWCIASWPMWPAAAATATPWFHVCMAHICALRKRMNRSWTQQTCVCPRTDGVEMGMGSFERVTGPLKAFYSRRWGVVQKWPHWSTCKSGCTDQHAVWGSTRLGCVLVGGCTLAPPSKYDRSILQQLWCCLRLRLL